LFHSIHLAYSKGISSFFLPSDAVCRTILNTLLDLFLGVFGLLDHLYIASIVFSEDMAQLHACVTFHAFTQINHWFLHGCAFPLN
jgi:hypothetical protein